MTEWFEGDVIANGVRLHYHRTGGNKPALVVRNDQGEFKAYLAICTHLDCTVQFMPENGIIWCACHNGKYDLNGRNIAGPPPRPLDQLQLNIQNNEILISREA